MPTYPKLEYVDADGSAIRAHRNDGSFRIYDSSEPVKFQEAKDGDYGPVDAYEPPPEQSSSESLSAQRANMGAETFQLSIAMATSGDLAAVEAAFALNPKANAIWKHSDYAKREGAILDALLTIRTNAQIDAIFLAAAQVSR